MKKSIYLYLILVTLLAPHTSFAASNAELSSANCRGQASTYGSSYSVAASMAFWGTLLFLGIGLAAILIDSDGSHAHSD